MKTILFKCTLAASLILFAGCRSNNDGSPGQSTKDPQYNEDARTPEDNNRRDEVDSTFRNRGNDPGSFR